MPKIKKKHTQLKDLMFDRSCLSLVAFWLILSLLPAVPAVGYGHMSLEEAILISVACLIGLPVMLLLVIFVTEEG